MIHHLLTCAFSIISLVSYSQTDSLIINTTISPDSIYFIDQKIDFKKTTDSHLRLSIKRNTTKTVSKLILYSGEKTFETIIPENPASFFHAEWTTGDPKNPITIRMTINERNCVTMLADGSAVNTLGALVVSNSSGEVIYEESCGVIEVKKKRKR